MPPKAMPGIGLNIDAEEADRLDAVTGSDRGGVLPEPVAGGLGRLWCCGAGVWPAGSSMLLDYAPPWHGGTITVARIMIRLVKGAYWDTEIKACPGRMACRVTPCLPANPPPMSATYRQCARRLLASYRNRIYPQFATHNAHTVSAIMHLAGEGRDRFRVSATPRHG